MIMADVAGTLAELHRDPLLNGADGANRVAAYQLASIDEHGLWEMLVTPWRIIGRGPDDLSRGSPRGRARRCRHRVQWPPPVEPNYRSTRASTGRNVVPPVVRRGLGARSRGRRTGRG
jgi:hypothetical protein